MSEMIPEEMMERLVEEIDGIIEMTEDREVKVALFRLERMITGTLGEE
jgi:hypothetical protein